MAAHIGFLSGNRGDVSRLGSKQSGVRATAHGWRIGGVVYSGTSTPGGWNHPDGTLEHEYVEFRLDAGSGYGSVPALYLRIDEGDNAKTVARKLREAARALTTKPGR